MSVYLDPMVNHRKRIGRAGPSWCHMIADTEEELHDLAARIGLRRSWFQGSDGGEIASMSGARASFPHYDIGTPAKREAAVAAGAVECDRATFVGHLRRLREARRPR